MTDLYKLSTLNHGSIKIKSNVDINVGNKHDGEFGEFGSMLYKVKETIRLAYVTIKITEEIEFYEPINLHNVLEVYPNTVPYNSVIKNPQLDVFQKDKSQYMEVVMPAKYINNYKCIEKVKIETVIGERYMVKNYKTGHRKITGNYENLDFLNHNYKSNGYLFKSDVEFLNFLKEIYFVLFNKHCKSYDFESTLSLSSIKNNVTGILKDNKFEIDFINPTHVLILDPYPYDVLIKGGEHFNSNNIQGYVSHNALDKGRSQILNRYFIILPYDFNKNNK